MSTHTINNLLALDDFAMDLLAGLAPVAEHATVVGLTGELGSGKTAFTQALGKALGVKEDILSPTFVLAKFYDLPARSPWKRLVHIDLYRIDDTAELSSLRFAEIVNDPTNLVIIEWPERAGAQFPGDAHVLQFTFVDGTTRTISELT